MLLEIYTVHQLKGSFWKLAGGGFGFFLSFCKILQHNISSFLFCDNAIINNEIIPLNIFILAPFLMLSLQ